jgi:hypothetical protein
METTYTAWITTDRSALDTDMCDVVILANDADGASVGDPIWKAVTTVSCAPGVRDDDELMQQAEALLAAAGWDTEGAPDGVPTGYVINVSKS